ncbi:MAG TPA: zinc-ribbon domain containing protein [Candidatus Dormibacteraeota bacterium]|nr:zinc-ribbon domain containing protein [Candidatus Dormibacteraeota bacterium]
MDCRQSFAFTAGEQRFYEAKGFANVPTRCVACRNLHKAARAKHVQSGARGAPSAPPMVAAECANCGAPTQVPASAKDRPAFCSDCFVARPTYR